MSFPSSAGQRDLPDPLSALFQSKDAPSYLTPEATRPLAAPVHSGRPPATARGDEPTSTGASAPVTFDIARLAPPLKGQTDAGKRGLPERAVISAPPKRFKNEEPAENAAVTAAQIAMLGGQWRPSADEDALNGHPSVIGPSPHPAVQDGKKLNRASKAMGVSEFMEKGIGGAQLPRKRQDRRDKERSKRHMGQSAIGSWKTEAEMVLRQQYDS
jgi:hypothetical protein